MAKILIEPAKARRTLSDQEALERALRALSDDVNSVRSGLRYKISGREAIDARLREAARQITREAESTRALRSGLEQAIVRYEQAERTNRDRVGAEKTSIQQGSGQVAPGTEAEIEEPTPPLTLLDMLLPLFKLDINPFLLGLLMPVTPLQLLLGGVLLSGSGLEGSFSGDWLGYQFSDGHPGVTAWLGKGSAKVEGDYGNAEVNAYLGKAKAEADADAHFMSTQTKKKYVDGEWTEKETFSVVDVSAKAGASASVIAADGKAEAGDDYFGAEVSAEGGIGNATAEAKGEFSIGDDGVNANLSGKAMVSAVEGKASGTINILGIEITGKIGGYAGAAGVEGKVGFEDNKFVLEGGFAALLGISGGVEIGFNETGWSNFWDMITFWD